MKHFLCITVMALVGVGFGHWLGRPEPLHLQPAKVVSPPPPHRQAPVSAILSSMNNAKGDDWRTLWKELERASLAELRTTFATMATEDPNKDRLGKRELRWLIQTMVARDPAGTIALVREHFHGLKRSHAYFNIIEHWGREDPEATLAFVATLDPSEDRSSNVHNATTSFLHEWAQRDPKAALDAWLTLPEPKLADHSSIPYSAECLARGASHHSETRATALALLTEQPPSDSRTSAMAGTLATWTSAGGFHDVQQWMSSQNLTDSEICTIAVIVANSALAEELSDAPDWLLEKLHTHAPSMHDRANYLDDFAETWARDSPNACAEWLSKLPPGEETDWAIRGFLRRLQYIDPATGFEWTRVISGIPLRQRMAREFWNHWRRRAPVSAQAYIPSLSPEERKWLGVP